jgi:hypothetical protein
MPKQTSTNVVPLRPARRNESPAQPYIDWLFDLMREQNVSKYYIATHGGPCIATLRNWESGRTRSPQLITIRFALRAMGYDLKIVRTNR